MMGEAQGSLEPFWIGFIVSSLILGLWADSWGRSGCFLGLLGFFLPFVALLTLLFLGRAKELNRPWRAEVEPPPCSVLSAFGEVEPPEMQAQPEEEELREARRIVRRLAWFLLGIIFLVALGMADGYPYAEFFFGGWLLFCLAGFGRNAKSETE